MAIRSGRGRGVVLGIVSRRRNSLGGGAWCGGRLVGAILLLLAAHASWSPWARADGATTRPPQIGRLQVIPWNGQGVNTTLDGTLQCAAFGGPDDIVPPTPFDQFFFFDGALGQFRPNTSDASVGVPAPNDTDRDQNWIYAFRFINDGGDDGSEGGAVINGFNIALPPKNSALENAFVSPGVPGIFITEYGATATETTVPGDQLVNYSGISAISEFFFLILTRPVLQPAPSLSSTSEVFFYYSPFSPSNRNASVIGQEVGQSRSHTLENTLVTAQFWPRFRCELAQVDDIFHDPVNGEEVPVRVTVSNQNMVFDTSDPNEWVLDASRPGNLLDIFLPGMGTTRLQHDRTDLLLTSAQAMAGCVSFRSTAGGADMGSLLGVLDIDRNKVPGGGLFSRDFEFFVFIRPGYFPTCSSPLRIENLLSARSPYDKVPPFEGWMFDGGAPGSLPQLDADPVAEDGFSCTLPIRIIGPPEVRIEKKVQFLDFSNPANPVPRPVPPTSQVDAPPCGKVRFTITVFADAENTENLTNFQLDDKLTGGLTFAGAVSPPGVTFDENPPGSGCFSVSGIPDLAPGGSFSFRFRACVDPGTPPGLERNTADVLAEGADTGLPTSNPSAEALVNVVRLNVALDNLGVNDNVICTGQNATFTFQVCNTGAWPLEVTVPPATLGPQLTLVSQSPAGGTVILLEPAQCQPIMVVAKAVAGGPPGAFRNCVALDNLTAHPDMVETAELDCDLVRSAQQCVDVINPVLAASCVSVVPSLARPGETVVMTKRVTNPGNVTLDPVTVSCIIHADLEVPMGSIPADLGPLAPGESKEFSFMATISPGAGQGPDLCVSCSYSGHPAVLPLGDGSCDRVVTSICCVNTRQGGGGNEIPALPGWGLVVLSVAFGGLLVRRRVF